MTRSVFISWMVLTAATCAVTSNARAQNAVDDILKKTKLTKQDKATLEAEVSSLVRQLADATPQVRKERMDYLIKLSKTKGASAAGLSAYAEAAAGELGGLTNNKEFDSAFSAIRVISEMPQIETSPALASGLASEHAAVRYLAAKGILNLHAKLKDDPKRVESLMQALGQRGAKEGDPLVLEMIYRASDFGSSAPDQKNMDAQASALAAVFAGRFATLNSTTGDETLDLPALSAATSAYAKAGKDSKTRLIASLTGLLEHAVGRYFAEETSAESLPKLADVITAEEKAVRTMIQASKVDPPKTTIASTLKGDDRTKSQAPARAAMNDLRNVLRGEPWKLP